jgi:hypothetical protein
MEKMKLTELLAREAESPPEYPDERVNSNLQRVSYSVSLREIDRAKKKAEQTYVEDSEKKNAWLAAAMPTLAETRALDLDKIKEKLDPTLNSCDALLLDKREENLHFLIEFKNVDKRGLYQKYLKYSEASNDQWIGNKVRGSWAILEGLLEFPEEFNPIVSKTHLIVVYGSNNVASTQILGYKHITDHDRRKAGNMRRSAVSTSDWESNEITAKLESLLQDKGFAVRTADTFSVRAIPELLKLKGRGKYRYLSMF